MAAAPVSVFFSNDYAFFASLSIDGRLRIHDTSSGKLLQENGNSSFTCLCWTGLSYRRERLRNESKQRKRKKLEENNNGLLHSTSDGDQVSGQQTIPDLVVGTQAGKLLIYSPTSGGTTLTYEDVDESRRINYLCHANKLNALYACSEGGHICEWVDGHLNSRWKASKTSINILAISPEEDALLSAGKMIKLWQLATKQLLQTFNGHSSAVTLLQFTPFKHPSSITSPPETDDAESSTADVDGRYFLSAGDGDRVINVWRANLNSPEKNSFATYLLSDSAIAMDTCIQKKSAQPLKLCVACKDGKVHFFESVLNGKSSKPIKAEKQLHILQRVGKSTPSAVNFMTMRLHEASDGVELNLVTGDSTKPRFDKYEYSKLATTSSVTHKISRNLLRCDTDEADPTIDHAIQDQPDRKVVNRIAPAALLGHVKSVSETSAQSTAEETVQEASFEERLQGHEARAPMKANRKTAPPSAQSVSNLLLQGLRSGDDEMLHNMLFRGGQKEALVRSTVERLPGAMATKLLKLIVTKVNENPPRAQALMVWIRITLATHMSFIQADPSMSDILAPLHQLVQAATDIYPQIVQLEGKIDFLLSNLSKKSSGVSLEEINDSAIIYAEESDTEEIAGLYDKSDGESDAEPWNPTEETDDDDAEETEEEEEEEESDASNDGDDDDDEMAVNSDG